MYTQALLSNIKCSQKEAPKTNCKLIHRTILTNEDGEEEDAGHPATGHEEDLGDVLRLLVLPN